MSLPVVCLRFAPACELCCTVQKASDKACHVRQHDLMRLLPSYQPCMFKHVALSTALQVFAAWLCTVVCM
jgi:hypothetical protein